MEIEVEQSRLAKALGIISRVAAGAKTTLPILSNVLIKVVGKKVTLTATNLDMAVVDYLPISKCKDGSITIPARLLAEFISNLPKGENIKIKAEDDKVTIKAGKYSSVINGTSAEEFPELPEINEKKSVIYKMSTEDFKTSISEVIIATSNDLTRPVLTGVYFNTYNNSLYIAATDGYRLAEKKFINKVQSEVSAVVPANSLQEVLRSITEDSEEIEILFDDSQVRFRLGELEITSKLIDGSYSNYRSLLPKDSELVVELSRDELIRTTKLAALFARNSGGSIVCETHQDKQTFSIYAVANELGENDSEIEVKGITKDLKTMLNSRYLIDALNSISSDTVEFHFTNSSMKPIILKNSKSSDYTHLIMPLEF